MPEAGRVVAEEAAAGWSEAGEPGLCRGEEHGFHSKSEEKALGTASI